MNLRSLFPRRPASQPFAESTPAPTPTDPSKVREDWDTVIQPDGNALHGLDPDDARLVAFCCAAKLREATSLIELMAPTRSSAIVRASQTLGKQPTVTRVLTLVRYLQPRAFPADLTRLINASADEVPWLAALASRSAPTQIREHLTQRVAVRQALSSGPAHPALERYARRFVLRALHG